MYSKTQSGSRKDSKYFLTTSSQSKFSNVALTPRSATNSLAINESRLFVAGLLELLACNRGKNILEMLQCVVGVFFFLHFGAIFVFDMSVILTQCFICETYLGFVFHLDIAICTRNRSAWRTRFRFRFCSSCFHRPFHRYFPIQPGRVSQ